MAILTNDEIKQIEENFATISNDEFDAVISECIRAAEAAGQEQKKIKPRITEIEKLHDYYRRSGDESALDESREKLKSVQSDHDGLLEIVTNAKITMVVATREYIRRLKMNNEHDEINSFRQFLEQIVDAETLERMFE